MSERLLEKIASVIEETNAIRDEIILAEGDRKDHIFLVYEGVIELSKRFYIDDPNRDLNLNSGLMRAKHKTT
jgi:hypothetical protein